MVEHHVLVDEVGSLQFQAEVVVQLVGQHQVQRVQGFLLLVAQARDAHCVDARPLQVVEQGGRQLVVVAQGRCIAQVGVHQVRRRALQRALVVGVGTAFGQLHAGVHVRAVHAQAKVFQQFAAELDFHTGSRTRVGILERVHRSTSGQCLRPLDGVLQNLGIARDGEHVLRIFGIKAFVAQVDVVVVSVLQVSVTTYLCRAERLLIEERRHLDERRPRHGARYRQAQAVAFVHRVLQVHGGEEVVLGQLVSSGLSAVAVIVHPLLVALVADAHVHQEVFHRVVLRVDEARVYGAAGIILVFGLAVVGDAEVAICQVAVSHELAGRVDAADGRVETSEVVVEARGAEGAAQIYFNKHLKDCTLPELALIAGLPQAPSVYSPFNNLDLAVKRRNQVLNRMYKMRFITKDEYNSAKDAKVTLNSLPHLYTTNKAPYFCDYVLKELEKLGIDSTQYKTAPKEKKKTLLKSAITQKSITKALADTSGMIPLQTFEGTDGKGNYAVRVAVSKSPNRIALVKSMLRNGSNVPAQVNKKSSRTIEEQVILPDDVLFNQFGTRLLYDKEGYPVLISFGQAGVINSGSEAMKAVKLESARNLAKTNARAALTNLLRSSTVFKSVVTQVSKAATDMKLISEDDGITEEMIESVDYTNSTDNTSTTRSQITNFAGIRELHSWSYIHPQLGHEVVGTILMWSPKTAAHAKGMKNAKATTTNSTPETYNPQESGVQRGVEFDDYDF